MNIRKATGKDIGAITKIYNQAIVNSNATFDTEEKSEEDRLQWLRDHGTTHPVLVAEYDEIAGWASLSKWSERSAYDSTVEISVYVDEKYRGKGTGKNLIKEITALGNRKGFHTIIARITSDNKISIKLHEDAGYKYTGTLYEAGKKFGNYLDVHFYQIVFKENV